MLRHLVLFRFRDDTSPDPVAAQFPFA